MKSTPDSVLLFVPDALSPTAGTTGSWGLQTPTQLVRDGISRTADIYPQADCHIPIPTTPLHPYPYHYGIVLNNVGTVTDPSSTYYSFLLGGNGDVANLLTNDAAAKNNMSNLFDNLAYEVYATNSNITLHNNIFVNPLRFQHIVLGSYGINLGGYGVTGMMNDGNKYQMTLEPTTTPVTGGAANTVNAFYGCRYGVYNNNYFHITGNNSYIVTDQDYSLPGYDANVYGYLVKSLAYDNVTFNNNNITNTPNGISFTSTFAPGHYVGAFTHATWIPPIQYAGPIQVNNNTIQAAFHTPEIAALHRRNGFGISVQNTISPSGTVVYTSTVQTNSNTINDANHGITVNGYKAQPAQTADNMITVISDPIKRWACWGINHTNNQNNTVVHNTVTGDNPGLATDPTADINKDSLRAFITAGCINPELNCNGAVSTNRGYEFFLQNLYAQWNNNHMNNNEKGFLINKAVLGPQGGMGNAMQNDWDISGSSIWNGTFMETFVIGSFSASASPFFVVDAPITNPLATPGTNGGPFVESYAGASGAVTTTTPSSTWNPLLCIQMNGGGGSGGGSTGTLASGEAMAYEPIARNDTPFANADPQVRAWIGQYAAWQDINIDTALMDSSATMDSFLVLAQNSRYAYLSTLEDSIITGNYTIASAMISSPPPPLVGSGQYFDSVTGVTIVDDSTNNYIINNYFMFYNTYINYINGGMTCVDSANLQYMANLCPQLYGTAVYQSRALYTAVFDELRVWNDDSCFVAPDSAQCQCGGNNGRKARFANNKTSQSNFNQHYILKPNPNNGSFVLQQLVSDINPVSTEIWNEIGQKVFDDQIYFSGNVSNISMTNIVPGLYLLKLTDINGRNFTFKFLVQ